MDNELNTGWYQVSLVLKLDTASTGDRGGDCGDEEGGAQISFWCSEESSAAHDRRQQPLFKH